MASQNLNVGTSANSNDGDTLRAAFVKLKQMFAEVYGQTYSEQGDLSGTDFKINESKLQLTASAVAGDDGKVLTYDHATGGFSWEDAFTGTIGDITGIVAGDGLTGSSLSSDEATLNVVAGTGITVAADSVSLASTVQDEITLNTNKTGITATQAGHITANNAKVSDQTVTLTDGGNVTITGTYPDFTLSSPDVVGAVTSVNTEVGAVVLDTADIAENTNLYYTEARVSANTDVAANTAKTGITSGQAGEITANTLKVGITTAQAGEITANNAKLTNATHTGDVTGDGALTIADDVVTAAKLDVSNTGANGQILQYNTDGTMTWVTGVTGDITSIIATDGLSTPDGTAGDVTISLATTVAGDGLTLASGVLSVDTIETGDIADDAVTSSKMELFDDALAATDTHMLIANGTDFFNKAMSGDATIANTGAITIADNAIDTDKILNDAVDADKLADSINTDIAAGVAKVSNVTHTGDVTGSGLLTIEDNKVITSKILNSNVTYAKIQNVSATDRILGRDSAGAGIVEEITPANLRAMISVADGANNYVHPDHSGDVTSTADGATVIATDAVTTLKIADVNVTTAKIADANVTTAKILNDNVTHDKLENRYTAINAIGTTSGAFNIDFSLGAVHTVDLNGAHTGTFTNFKVGQVIDIIITGNHALTFSATASGTPAINKVGTTAYDGTADQIIQVQCASDNSTTPIFYYVCNTYAGDPTP